MTISLDHKHIVAFALSALLALGLVYTIEARIADKAQSKADAAEARATLIADQNKEFQASVQQQLNALSAANASLSSALASQKQKDAQLKPEELGNRLADLAGIKHEEVQTLPTGSFQLTADAVLQSALKLEEVPVLTQQLGNANKALDLEKQAHNSDNVSGAASLAACKADLSATKAQARRSKLKWLGVGVVIGFIGRGFVGGL
jgi:ATP-dependent Clp protease ATP-binding subunit ClpA